MTLHLYLKSPILFIIRYIVNWFELTFLSIPLIIIEFTVPSLYYLLIWVNFILSFPLIIIEFTVSSLYYLLIWVNFILSFPLSLNLQFRYIITYFVAENFVVLKQRLPFILRKQFSCLLGELWKNKVNLIRTYLRNRFVNKNEMKKHHF